MVRSFRLPALLLLAPSRLTGSHALCIWQELNYWQQASKSHSSYRLGLFQVLSQQGALPSPKNARALEATNQLVILLT